MKQLFFYLLFNQLFADIAPNPITVNGIYTIDECKIQMVSEYVFADLYNDSAKVECIFNMENFGDAIDMQIGFPEMCFQYWSVGGYTPTDKEYFQIYVDGKKLTEEDIQVPSEIDELYKKYMYAYNYDEIYKKKKDSIYTANGVVLKKRNTVYPMGTYPKIQKALQALKEDSPYSDLDAWYELEEERENGNFPWYVWNVKFNEREKKQIKVVYTMPSGCGYGKNYRYFNYILETGRGWHKTIEKATIKLQLHDINRNTIEEITPSNYSIDTINKKIQWTFNNLEPTKQDDIYVRYFNVKERRRWEKLPKRRKRAYKYRLLRPRTWFR